MITQTETRNCLACGDPLRGRSDKKFCDDHCRNGYNNQLKSIANSQIRNINNALKKNRRILEELLPPSQKPGKAHKETLLQKGFLFKYVTHLYTNKKGSTYHFCYDYGYLPLEDDWYLIVARNEEL